MEFEIIMDNDGRKIYQINHQSFTHTKTKKSIMTQIQRIVL